MDEIVKELSDKAKIVHKNKYWYQFIFDFYTIYLQSDESGFSIIESLEDRGYHENGEIKMENIKLAIKNLGYDYE
tara:strand:- start:1137 stop:1361 length:225 start_codon:yes stop_codon:yes gene_type:complete